MSLKLVNNNSTVIQQLSIVELDKNAHNQDTEIDTDTQEFIQQITKDKGERGCVEQERFDGVLQNEQISNSSATTEDTSSQTDFFDRTSQQEAFQQKYQPVEVLNSDGKRKKVFFHSQEFGRAWWLRREGLRGVCERQGRCCSSLPCRSSFLSSLICVTFVH